MKRSVRILSGMFAIAACIVFTNCEGPAGPAGEDGQDASAYCSQCHSIANMNLVAAEYETSGHAAGASVGYAGARNGCAKCHSHEGFVETQHTGLDTTAANIPIPTHISCETCHNGGHVSFDTLDGTDYALGSNDAVALDMYGGAQEVDFEGSSNLCANCHQPRRSGPVGDDEGNFRITSTHWGPHHGPQATYLAGLGAYEVEGSEAYPEAKSSSHYKGGACVACHMGEADENGGGHTFTANVAGCTDCHTSATTLDINGVQTEVAELLHDLEEILKSNGVLDDEGHVVPATYTVDLAGAYYNYIGIEEDRSLGVHNPAYIKAVLKNTIAAVE